MRSFIYYSVDLPGITIKKIDTNESFKDKLELKCYYATKDGIYFEKPIYQDLTNYMLIDEFNNKVVLKDFLNSNNSLIGKYVVISSRLNKIVAVEDLDIGYTEAFYCLRISHDLAQYLENLCLDNIDVLQTNFNQTLYSFDSDQIRDDILFFIDSKDTSINYLLNKLRVKYIKDRLFSLGKKLIQEGMYLNIEEVFNTFKYDLFSQYELDFKLINTEFLCKNKVLNTLKLESLNELKTHLEYNKQIITVYILSYMKFIKTIFKSDFSIKDLNKYESNLFCFGYTNSIIIEDMIKLLNNGEGELYDIF